VEQDKRRKKTGEVRNWERRSASRKLESGKEFNIEKGEYREEERKGGGERQKQDFNRRWQICTNGRISSYQSVPSSHWWRKAFL